MVGFVIKCIPTLERDIVFQQIHQPRFVILWLFEKIILYNNIIALVLMLYVISSIVLLCICIWFVFPMLDIRCLPFQCEAEAEAYIHVSCLLQPQDKKNKARHKKAKTKTTTDKNMTLFILFNTIEYMNSAICHHLLQTTKTRRETKQRRVTNTKSNLSWTNLHRVSAIRL